MQAFADKEITTKADNTDKKEETDTTDKLADDEVADEADKAEVGTKMTDKTKSADGKIVGEIDRATDSLTAYQMAGYLPPSPNPLAHPSSPQGVTMLGVGAGGGLKGYDACSLLSPAGFYATTKPAGASAAETLGEPQGYDA